MDRDKLKKLINKLIAIGKVKNFITYQTINEILPEDIISKDDIDNIFMMLREMGIEVVDSEDQVPVARAATRKRRREPVLSEPITRNDDPVRTYLREIGRVPLQDRDRETEIAMRIAAKKREVAHLIFSCIPGVRAFIEKVRGVEKGQIPLEDFIQIDLAGGRTRYSRRGERQDALNRIRKTRDSAKELERLSQMQRDEIGKEEEEDLKAKIAEMEKVVAVQIAALRLHPWLVESAVENLRERVQDAEGFNQKIQTFLEKEHFTQAEEMRQKINEIESNLGLSLENARQILNNITELEEAVIQAKQNMMETSTDLVNSVTMFYSERGLETEGLQVAIYSGLRRAIEEFDYRKGDKFSSFARKMIRIAITKEKRKELKNIRVPVHMIDAINRVVKASRKLVQELGREPTPEEIAERLEMASERVKAILKVAQEPISLDKPIGEDEDSHFGDFVEDPAASSPTRSAAYLLLEDQIEQVLSTLSKQEERVIRLRFGIGDGYPRTLEEVGVMLNLTRQRIQQIEVKALRKLRHPSGSQKLRGYADGVG